MLTLRLIVLGCSVEQPDDLRRFGSMLLDNARVTRQVSAARALTNEPKMVLTELGRRG